jgi:hypothetical protein
MRSCGAKTKFKHYRSDFSSLADVGKDNVASAWNVGVLYRRERGSISPNCNKLDFESVVQVNFAASDPTTMTTLGGAPRPTMFLWYLRARDPLVFQVCDRLV